MNKKKYLLSILTAIFAFVGVVSVMAQEKEQKDVIKSGFKEVTVDNQTDKAFNMKFQDKTTAARNGQGEYIKGKSKKTIKTDENRKIAYNGSEFFLQVDAEPFRGGKKEIVDKFNWQGPKEYKYNFALVGTTKDTPEQFGAIVSYKQDGDKVIIEIKPAS